MAGKEYIKRNDVVKLIENAIRKSKTANGVLVCAHLRTAVMGLRHADVAPRAEVAREIFAEVKNTLVFGADRMRVANLEKEYMRKYAQPEPPKGD